MATMHCPHCHAYTSITIASTGHRYEDMYYNKVPILAVWQQDNRFTWAIGLCNHCRTPVLVQLSNAQVWEVFPHPMPSPTPAEIPEAIRESLVEAKKCASVQAWNATVAMCRRSIQAAAIEKGAPTGGSIVGQIDFLLSQGYITKGLHDTATVVRWTGNHGAHPDDVKLTQTDAEQTLHLTEEILRLLYEVPARTTAQRTSIGK